jgi:acetyltransferase-like isoleucine patch superfamily enzyme
VTVEVRVRAAEGAVVEEGAVVGQPYDGWREPAVLGERCHVRANSVIYADTRLGDRTVTGVGVLIREHTTIGRGCVIGSHTIIEGHAEIADEVVMQSTVYLPTHVSIGPRAFLGPHAVLVNDRYPLRRRGGYRPEGPTIAEDATIGANATVLPGVHVGAGAFVAAGAVVTRDVPAWSLAVGVPARIVDLPGDLREPNAVRGLP